MAFTTYAAFVPTLMDISVSGVTTKLDEPPTQLSGGLPLMYPRLPTGHGEIVAFDVSSGLLEATCELVIVIEPVLQNLQAVNFAAALSLMDALDTGLRAGADGVGIDSWEMRIVEETIGDTAYWLLITAVEASG
ncbi:hypothetical protein LCGC14_0386700 [marine sediment metagenome]|uniref:DUF3168 domain-containing protein n=1 Tax=marine sediment metagenome TaxID=412755 RepID=A0A0F9TIS6_9ZZZZ